MKKALEFLRECGTFYIATTDGDQPRVRPFGAVFEYEKRLYITTNNTKNCYKQMIKNPKVEICAMNKDRKWIRICGELAPDDRREAKVEALNTNPRLNSMYNIDDGIFAVLYFTRATAVISSFKEKDEIFSLY